MPNNHTQKILFSHRSWVQLPHGKFLFAPHHISDLLGQRLSARQLTSLSASGDIASQIAVRSVVRGRLRCATQRSTRSASDLVKSILSRSFSYSVFHISFYSFYFHPSLHLYSTTNHYEDIGHPYRCFICRRLGRGRHPQNETGEADSVLDFSHWYLSSFSRARGEMARIQIPRPGVHGPDASRGFRRCWQEIQIWK